MDDNQCRVCLGEANDKRLSVFKRMNGLTIEEKLNFVAGLQIFKEDNFSKVLCLKCFNETCSAYNLRKKCLDTDRTLKNLEKKFNEKVHEWIAGTVGSTQSVTPIKEEQSSKEEYFEYDFVEQDGETSDQVVIVEEPIEEFEDQIFELEEFQERKLQNTTTEVYEEVEYLEPDTTEEPVEELVTLVVEAKKENSSTTRPKVNKITQSEINVKKHNNWKVHQKGEADPFVCTICNYEFEQKPNKENTLAKSMQKHFAAHENGKMNSCLSCPEVFKSPHQLEWHKYRHHLNPQCPNKCRGCRVDFPSYQKLHLHLMSSNCKDLHDKPFKCYICNQTFVMGIAKKKHIQTEHKDKAGADCSLCLRCKIPSAVAFENHYKTHFAEPRFYCNFCARPFYESDRLQTHIRRAHETTKFSCNWCDKTFRDKSGIARHILGVHFKQRNHQCNICSKSFTASYNLKEHMFSVHKQANKFYTCETCATDFLYRSQFERHRNNCSGIPEKRRK